MNQHVIPYRGNWAVKPARHSAIVVTKTQREAIERAKKEAKWYRSFVIIHRRNGRFRAA